jgi:serine/threonine-protein kinase
MLSRFRLEKKLGRGAAGVVYLATDTLLKQPIALKIIHDHLVENHEVRERFKRELVLTRRVSHPGVCRLHDVHEDKGITFITMEYVEGQTLAQLIQNEGKLSPSRTLELLRSLAPPLDAAHAAGVVHRDLKPGNIMVRPDGSVSILDFGMATADDVSRITHAGRTVGSLRFIAPEVWEGHPAVAVSDVYALGVILYACMAGRLPYDAVTPAEAFQAQKNPPPPLSQFNAAVSDAVDAVVKRAMLRRQAERTPSAGAVLADFEKAMSNESAAHDTVAVAPVVIGAPSASGEAAPLLEPPHTEPPLQESIDDATSALTAANTMTGLRAVPRSVLAIAGGALLLVVAVVAAVASGGQGEAAIAEPTSAPTDAGPAVAPVDAGPPAAALDGDDDDPTIAGATPAQLRAAVQSAMKKRGFLVGDVPAADGLVAKAKRLEAAGRIDEATAALLRARTIVKREVIDRGFITSKQKRLHFSSEKASPQAQAKIAALERDVEKLVVARDYAGANEKLNKAFTLMR